MSIKEFIKRAAYIWKHSSNGNGISIGKLKYRLLRSVHMAVIHGNLAVVRQLAWKRKNGQVSINPLAEANPHIVIFGMSGQGKSTLLRSMVADISNSGTKIVLFDAHNEHESAVMSMGGRVIDAAKSGINIFSLEGSTVGERIDELSMLFREVYSLGYLQAMKLGECMWYAYRKCGASSRNDTQLYKVPSLNDLIAEISAFISLSKNSSERNSLIHIRSRLTPLANNFGSDNGIEMSEIESGIVSFSLAGLRSEEAQLIYINELLRRLYARMKSMAKERGVSMYIVIDEAQYIISESDSQIVKKITEEGRKYGIGVIIATHMASRLPKEIIANASTFITFYSREPQEVNYIANVMSEGIAEKAYEVRKMLQSLRQNEAMVISCSIRDPCVVETPRTKTVKEHSVPSAAVEMIAKKPVLVSEPYKGNDMQSLSVVWKGSPEHWVMDKNTSASIEHEVYVKKIFEVLDAAGIKATIINNSHGPDLVAYKGRARIAIEYETGRKEIGKTAKMINLRKLEYDKVIIVVNKDAYNFYKNYFELDNVQVISAELSSLADSLKHAVGEAVH